MILAPMFCPDCASPLPHEPPVTCPRCGTTHYANAKPCGGALIADGDGRLLLVRRAHDPYDGCWDIPGGFCELREHPRDAATREALEETGLEVAAGELAGMWLDDYGDTGIVTLNCYFRCRVTGGSERAQAGEVAELRWFSPGELPVDELAFPEHERLVLEAWRGRPTS
jgi:ADP-ribose pyrophosphatase YjhB (NUDIX family)